MDLRRLRTGPRMLGERRVIGELRQLRSSPVFTAGAGVPRAAGSPVVLIPGFLATDTSMSHMGSWLKRMGYRPARAGIGINVDCAARALDRLEPLIDRQAEEHGERVAVIGQSRGGCFARALAVRRPDVVAGIVTLGSPHRDVLAVHPAMWAPIAALMVAGTLGHPRSLRRACLRRECCGPVEQLLTAPVPDGVGFVSVHSRTDGIVDWRACVDPWAENVEVAGSHTGMALNAAVYGVIGTALAGFTTGRAAVASAA
jgi:pimeloyl-ACP methyl ester carboxylesterase